MKKLGTVLIILAIILGAGIAEHFFIADTFNVFRKKIAEIDASLDTANYTAALDSTHSAQAWWDNRQEILEAIAYSPDIRQIDVVLGEIEGSLDTDDNKNAESKIDSLYELIDNIEDILDFNFSDII